MGLKRAKPGRHTPKCAACGRAFLLTVPADPSAPPSAAPLPEAIPAAPPDLGATTPPEAVPADAAVTVAKPASEPAAAVPPAAQHVPGRLGGYHVLRELGRGGMGTVYLARQLSLDRLVALKVMNPAWAKDATFMARFTREAFAAAQLVHPNVVQVYDLGSDPGFSFFSMELVEGESLGDLVKRRGRLDVREAVGYVLQAARGLKYGHDRGMVHRDVKPDNLMLNKDGLVKVADLGLVKTPRALEIPVGASADAPASELTVANAAMGTPAYMAPEQARNAARVDARADIYSLGCTLYVLLTGQPPFKGSTALEVISKHAYEPVVPPDTLVRQVPRALSEVLLKMVAKKPEDRYADMGAVVQALEGFLGVQGSGRFQPNEEQAALVARSAARFAAAPAARLRGRILAGFFAGAVLLIVGCALLHAWLPALCFATLAVLTPLCYVLVEGVAQRTYLLRKLRELVLESRRTDWLLALGGGALLLGVLYLIGLLGIFVLVCVLAAGLAVTFHLFVDHRLALERRGSVAQVEGLLRGLRLQGVGEEALQEFVCRFGGTYWEGLYEALYGYESKLHARARWAESEPGRRVKYGAWRDPVVRWLEARQRARRAARDRQLLQAAEQRSLEARGVAEAEPAAKAEQAAEALVGRAEALREEGRARALQSVAELLELHDEEAARPAPRRRTGPLARAAAGVGSFFFGPRARFVVGALFVAGCLGWMDQNGLLPWEEIKQAADQAVQQQDVPDLSNVNVDWGKQTKPLQLAPVPEALTRLVSSFNAGVAGLLLVLSALVLGPRIAVFAWAAALVALAGAWLAFPAVGPVAGPQVSMIAGAAVGVVGFLIDRYA
jgi:hypothetical protein